MNAAALANVTNDELIDELKRRHLLPACPCRKWQTYAGAYDAEGYTWRCHGCRRSVRSCTC